MGQLFSSCRNNSQHGENTSETSSDGETGKRSTSKHGSGKNKTTTSKTGNTVNSDDTKMKQNESATSVKGTQETTNSTAEIKSQLNEQENKLAEDGSSKPAAQSPPKPAFTKPVRHYDYICEFLFDVKAVGNSVNLECRISWTRIDASLYLLVRIHMERK